MSLDHNFRNFSLLATLLTIASAAKAQFTPKPYNGQGPSCYIEGPGIAILVNAPNANCDPSLEAGVLHLPSIPDTSIADPVLTKISIDGGKVKKFIEEGREGCLIAGQKALGHHASSVTTCYTAAPHNSYTVIAVQTCVHAANGTMLRCAISGDTAAKVVVASPTPH